MLGAALVIGFVAGLISTYGYNVLQPWLEKNLALHDTCGINNLHGMPSVIGAIASIFTVSGGMSHSVNQLWSLIVLLATCIPMGLATGYVLKMVSFICNALSCYFWWLNTCLMLFSLTLSQRMLRKKNNSTTMCGGRLPMILA